MSRILPGISGVLGLAAAGLLMAACGSDAHSGNNPANPVAATQTAASGPVLDAWWNSKTPGLRIIYGVTGAAYQGAPEFTGGTYSGAAVCMRAGIALLTTPAGAWFVTTLPQGIPAPVASQGIRGAEAVFSPGCAIALAFAAGKPGGVLLRGLTGTPSASAVSIPVADQAAVSDSGAILVSVPQVDGSAAIELLAGGSGTPREVIKVSKLGGMAFVPGSDSALIADESAGTVTEAANLTGNLSLTHIAGPADGIAQPIALAVSGNGHSAVVANQKDSGIVRIDLTGQSAAVRTVCPCTATELRSLAGNLAFRVNEPGTGTVWAYDGDAATPRFAFIPSDETTSATAGGQR